MAGLTTTAMKLSRRRCEARLNTTSRIICMLMHNGHYTFFPSLLILDTPLLWLAFHNISIILGQREKEQVRSRVKARKDFKCVAPIDFRL